MMLSTEIHLEKIRDYLLEKYAPEAILLHGSRLRGDPAATSDYDIVMITSNAEGIYPHEYEGMMLDIDIQSHNTCFLETSNKYKLFYRIAEFMD